jgi:hypothetical protein
MFSIKTVNNKKSGGKKMLKKSILKAALVIVLALAMVIPATAMSTRTVTTNVTETTPVAMSRAVIFEDSFETYDDWLIDFPPWTCIDVDGTDTFGHNQYTWPNQYTPYAFIIFNPDTTTPPTTDPQMQPRTGDKYCAGFNDNNAGYINDDWLITPQLSGSFGRVTFWAHSYSDQYNLEKFKVCVSTTDTDPASFTEIGEDTAVPLDWTNYTYDISSYGGQSIYIGIHMVSTDSWYLLIDDFIVVEGGDTTPPETTIDLDGDLQGSVYASDVTVTLTATDSGSGVDYTMVKVDDGTFEEYDGAFVVSGNGEHTVAYYSVDIKGNEETEKSAEFTIQYPIEITISGGFGVKAAIKNTGAVNLTNVSWSIALDGKLIFVGKSQSDVIDSLAVGETVTVKDFVIGFGKTGIAVEAGGMEATAQGTAILFFVIGVA